jgi:hypothetical protein
MTQRVHLLTLSDKLFKIVCYGTCQIENYVTDRLSDPCFLFIGKSATKTKINFSTTTLVHISGIVCRSLTGSDVSIGFNDLGFLHTSAVIRLVEKLLWFSVYA